MADQLQLKNSAGGDETTLPAEFKAACVLAFAAGVWATVYFCRSMCCEMEMPGGWRMPMMWMRMRGQTWLASAIIFLLMWLAMMVAMMMPTAAGGTPALPDAWGALPLKASQRPSRSIKVD